MDLYIVKYSLNRGKLWERGDLKITTIEKLRAKKFVSYILLASFICWLHIVKYANERTENSLGFAPLLW